MTESRSHEDLSAKLAQCRPFLRGDYASIDPRLPHVLDVLQSRSAGECWHKHGTFFEHLLHTYQILKLWGCPDAVALCGLFHSAYSNSYVNLAIFAPDVDRSILRDLIGVDAEALVHTFCVVPRQEMIFTRFLHVLTDGELLGLLKQYNKEERKEGSKMSEGEAKEVHEKKRLLVPKEGMVMKHIRTGEEMVLPRRLVAVFVLLSMADFADQFFGWQDLLWGNEDGEFRMAGNEWHSLWPGSCKPGLWLTVVSRLGVLLNILLHEDAAEQASELPSPPSKTSPFHTLAIPVPPIFNNCTEILSPANQIASLGQYWEAVHVQKRDELVSTALPLLKSCVERNPYVAEPHFLMAQIYLNEEKDELAETEAKEGLRLLLDWTTAWDKRMTWEGWVAWGRVLLENAVEKSWPRNILGINSLGLVK